MGGSALKKLGSLLKVAHSKVAERRRQITATLEQKAVSLGGWAARVPDAVGLPVPPAGALLLRARGGAQGHAGPQGVALNSLFHGLSTAAA